MTRRPWSRRSRIGSPRRSSGSAASSSSGSIHGSICCRSSCAGEAVLGRAAAAGAVERFCKGIIDVVAPVRRRRQAAGRVLRGARRATAGSALESVSRYASEVGPARDRRRRSGATSARPPAPTQPRSSSRAVRSRRSPTRSPSTPTSARTRSIRSSPRVGVTAPGIFLPRPHLERGRARPAGGGPLRRDTRAGGTLRPRGRMGGGSRRRARDVECGRGRRRHRPATDRGCPADDAAGDHPPAGSGRAGSDAGRRRPGVHEWTCECPGQRLPLGDLRLPRH